MLAFLKSSADFSRWCAPPVIARTIVLNAALGLLFGFAYWRYALEYAMFSHALVHVVFGVVGAVAAGAAPTLLGP